jgi:DNA-binding GntR family transcriptional regulator
MGSVTMSEETVAIIDTRSLVDKVYDFLLGRIIEGDFKYGETLNIKKQADELNVSTMPVREALKRLEYEKIVEIKPRSNCRIRIPSKQEIREIYELREVLELHAIKKFRQNHDVQKLIQLQDITRQMKEVDQIPDDEQRAKRAIALDREFHAEICKLAENESLNSMYRQLNLHLNMTMIHEKTYLQLRKVYYNSHAEILRCLRRQNEGEVLLDCVQKHFENVKGYLFS